jgi:phospholipid/cholesterol/gamma-HCH transport system ATP-binding protein
MDTPQASPVIEISGLVTRFGEAVVHEGIDLAVRRGEVFAIAGPSGCGKSTLLKEIIMLLKPAAGQIRVLGKNLDTASESEVDWLRRRWGVMFQGGALFSSMSVLENVEMPLKEHTDLMPGEIRELALIKIALAGLPAESAYKFPRELSGGLRKRAALARAIALDPDLLFLDEPSAGLDPVAASALDELVLGLKESLKLTIIIVTHDLDLLWRVTDRVAVLGERRVVGLGSMDELSKSEHPLVREYFYGPRGRAVRETRWNPSSATR